MLLVLSFALHALGSRALQQEQHVMVPAGLAESGVGPWGSRGLIPMRAARAKLAEREEGAELLSAKGSVCVAQIQLNMTHCQGHEERCCCCCCCCCCCLCCCCCCCTLLPKGAELPTAWV